MSGKSNLRQMRRRMTVGGAFDNKSEDKTPKKPDDTSSPNPFGKFSTMSSHLLCFLRIIIKSLTHDRNYI